MCSAYSGVCASEQAANIIRHKRRRAIEHWTEWRFFYSLYCRCDVWTKRVKADQEKE